MDYFSTEVFQSKLFPEVTAKLKKMSQRRRAEFNLNFAKLIQQAQDLGEKHSGIDEKYSAYVKAYQTAKAAGAELPVFPDEDAKAFLKAQEDLERFDQDVMHPAVLRWGLASIEGLAIDGAPATVESLLDGGPPELVEEISKEITRVMRLSAVEAKNSESPTTSGAVADGATNDSTAPTAKIETSGNSAIAASSLATS
jgi:hypothetical protein